MIATVKYMRQVLRFNGRSVFVIKMKQAKSPGLGLFLF